MRYLEVRSDLHIQEIGAVPIVTSSINCELPGEADKGRVKDVEIDSNYWMVPVCSSHKNGVYPLVLMSESRIWVSGMSGR